MLFAITLIAGDKTHDYSIMAHNRLRPQQHQGACKTPRDVLDLTSVPVPVCAMPDGPRAPRDDSRHQPHSQPKGSYPRKTSEHINAQSPLSFESPEIRLNGPLPEVW